jgi:hypothetical protein
MIRVRVRVTTARGIRCAGVFWDLETPACHAASVESHAAAFVQSPLQCHHRQMNHLGCVASDPRAHRFHLLAGAGRGVGVGAFARHGPHGVVTVP